MHICKAAFSLRKSHPALFLSEYCYSDSAPPSPITKAEPPMQIHRSFRLLTPTLFAAILALGLFAATGSAAGPQQPYHVLDHWKLTDAGWWDYLIVDSPAHRLYITRGDHVDVLDTATGKQVGT